MVKRSEGDRAKAEREFNERAKVRTALPPIAAGEGVVIEAGEYSDKQVIVYRAVAAKNFNPDFELEEFLRSRGERRLDDEGSCAASAQHYAFVAWLTQRGCIVEEPTRVLDLSDVDGLAVVLD